MVKWVLTSLFTVVYLVLTLGVIRIFFNSKQFLHITIFIFAIIVFVSFILYAVFGFFDEQLLEQNSQF